MIIFPEFHCEDTLELPAIAAMSGIAGAVILPLSTVLGLIALIPCLLIMLSWIRNGILNTYLRFQWSRRFSRRLSCWQLLKQLKTKPKNIVIYIRYYGCFDVARKCPAAVLEDCQTGELTAIYPSSWQIAQWCEQNDVTLIKG